MNKTSAETRWVIFCLAHQSGMAIFASETVNAASDLIDDVSFISPVASDSSSRATQVPILRRERRSRLGRIWELILFNLRATQQTWNTCRRNDLFLMVDLYATVPLSLLPFAAAKLRGTLIVFNAHDLEPHAYRYPIDCAGLRSSLIGLRSISLTLLRQPAPHKWKF